MGCPDYFTIVRALDGFPSHGTSADSGSMSFISPGHQYALPPPLFTRGCAAIKQCTCRMPISSYACGATCTDPFGSLPGCRVVLDFNLVTEHWNFFCAGLPSLALNTTFRPLTDATSHHGQVSTLVFAVSLRDLLSVSFQP